MFFRKDIENNVFLLRGVLGILMFATLFYGAFFSWSDSNLTASKESNIEITPPVAEANSAENLSQKTAVVQPQLIPSAPMELEPLVAEKQARSSEEVFTTQPTQTPSIKAVKWANTEKVNDLEELPLRDAYFDPQWSQKEKFRSSVIPASSWPSATTWSVFGGVLMGANFYAGDFLPSQNELSNSNGTQYSIVAEQPENWSSLNTWGVHIGTNKDLSGKWSFISQLDYQKVQGTTTYSAHIQEEKEVEQIVYVPVDQNGQTTVKPIVVTNNAVFNYQSDVQYRYQYQLIQLGVGVGYEFQRYRNWVFSSNVVFNAGYSFSSQNSVWVNESELELEPFSSVVYSPQLGVAMERSLGSSSSLLFQPIVGYHFYDQSNRSNQSTFLNFAFGFKHRL